MRPPAWFEGFDYWYAITNDRLEERGLPTIDSLLQEAAQEIADLFTQRQNTSGSKSEPR